MIQILLVVLFSITICMCQDDYKWPSSDEDECLKQLSLDKDQIGSIVVNYTPGKLPEDNEDFVKFSECRAKQAGTENEDSTFNYENLVVFVTLFDKRVYGKEKGFIGEALATKAVESCKHVQHDKESGKDLVQMQNCIDFYLVDSLNKNQ